MGVSVAISGTQYSAVQFRRSGFVHETEAWFIVDSDDPEFHDRILQSDDDALIFTESSSDLANRIRQKLGDTNPLQTRVIDYSDQLFANINRQEYYSNTMSGADQHKIVPALKSSDESWRIPDNAPKFDGVIILDKPIFIGGSIDELKELARQNMNPIILDRSVITDEHVTSSGDYVDVIDKEYVYDTRTRTLKYNPKRAKENIQSRERKKKQRETESTKRNEEYKINNAAQNFVYKYPQFLPKRVKKELDWRGMPPTGSLYALNQIAEWLKIQQNQRKGLLFLFYTKPTWLNSKKYKQHVRACFEAVQPWATYKRKLEEVILMGKFIQFIYKEAQRLKITKDRFVLKKPPKPEPKPNEQTVQPHPTS